MSHVEEHEPDSVEQAIHSLHALDLAARRLDGELVRGQTTYHWYGRHVGDYPIPEGRSKEDLGTCEHALKFAGCTYEVGVVSSKKFEGTYSLMYDFYEKALKDRLGGTKAGRLMQMYQVEVAKLQAEQLDSGQYTETEDEEGNIIIEIDTTLRIGH